MAEQPRREHTRVVDDEHVTWTKDGLEIGDVHVADRAGRTIDYEQT